MTVGFCVRFHHQRLAVATAIASAVGMSPDALGAQMRDGPMASHDSTRASLGVRAQAIALVTRVDPGFANRAYTEGYLAQPVIMAHGSALRDHISALLTLDFEGLTLDRGQLNPGAYGEGYVRSAPPAHVPARGHRGGERSILLESGYQWPGERDSFRSAPMTR